MSGAVALEVSGAGERLVRLPRTARSRNAICYVKLLSGVRVDEVWGGWSFEGPAHRPGSTIPLAEIPAHGLALECAGAEGKGRGHQRNPTTYILWRYDRGLEVWRKLAESVSVNRDWTLDLGPIAVRELDPPRPFRIDPNAAAERLVQAINREIRPLEFGAQVLVIRLVQDRLAAGIAG